MREMRIRTQLSMPKPLMTVSAVVICFMCCVSVGSCQRQTLEKEFFAGPASTRIERLRQYSLEDQYRIFRYGNDKLEPPSLGLARPIAERGGAAVPFLLERLNSTPDDMTVRDVLLIFETMSSTKSYEVKSNLPLMNTLRLRVSAIKDSGWKDVCSNMLGRIEKD